MKDEAKRFQNQPWYIKLWRFRWYLLIPFEAVYWFLIDEIRQPKDKLDFKIHWSVAIGLAQHRMKWFYTADEVISQFKFKQLKSYNYDPLTIDNEYYPIRSASKEKLDNN